MNATSANDIVQKSCMPWSTAFQLGCGIIRENAFAGFDKGVAECKALFPDYTDDKGRQRLFHLISTQIRASAEYYIRLVAEECMDDYAKDWQTVVAAAVETIATPSEGE